MLDLLQTQFHCFDTVMHSSNLGLLQNPGRMHPNMLSRNVGDLSTPVQELRLELQAADEQYHSLHSMRMLLREQNHMLGKQRQVKLLQMHFQRLA